MGIGDLTFEGSGVDFWFFQKDRPSVLNSELRRDLGRLSGWEEIHTNRSSRIGRVRLTIAQLSP
jgi:hypothetical protein